MIQVEERLGTLPTLVPARSVQSPQVLDLARSVEEGRQGRQARLEALPLARSVNLQRRRRRPVASLDSLRHPQQAQPVHLEVEDCLGRISQQHRRLEQVRIYLSSFRSPAYLTNSLSCSGSRHGSASSGYDRNCQPHIRGPPRKRRQPDCPVSIHRLHASVRRVLLRCVFRNS